MRPSSEIEKEISELTAKLAPLDEKSSVYEDEFYSQLPQKVAQWGKAEARRAAERKPDRMQEMGVEGLGVFKRELEEWAEGLDEVVKDLRAWAKRRSENAQAYSGHSQNTENPFESEFRKAGNTLGPLLEKNGFLVKTGSKDETWKFHYSDWKYQYGVGFDWRQWDCLVKRSQVLGERGSIKKDIEKLEKELTAAKAAELWDAS